MTDLLLSHGSTKYKEQVQKLLESQPAVKKDRAGELALGNSFLDLPGRGVVSRGAGPAQKPGGGAGAGVKWPGGGRGAQARDASKNATLPAYESFYLHFFVCFLFFLRSFFFVFFLHFLDRVCHLHRLPNPYKKKTRK